MEVPAGTFGGKNGRGGGPCYVKLWIPLRSLVEVGGPMLEGRRFQPSQLVHDLVRPQYCTNLPPFEVVGLAFSKGCLSNL